MWTKYLKAFKFKRIVFSRVWIVQCCVGRSEKMQIENLFASKSRNTGSKWYLWIRKITELNSIIFWWKNSGTSLASRLTFFWQWLNTSWYLDLNTSIIESVLFNPAWILKGWVHRYRFLHAYHYLNLRLLWHLVSLHQRAPVPVGGHPVEVPHLAPEAAVLTPLLGYGLPCGHRGHLPVIIGAGAVSREPHLRRTRDHWQFRWS